MTKLDQLERLSKAATPGPWQKSIGLSGVIPTKNYDSAFDCGPKDAELIASMRNNIDALIEVARSARALLENHEECHGSCVHCLEDGRGTHAEQLETLLNKLERGE